MSFTTSSFTDTALTLVHDLPPLPPPSQTDVVQRFTSTTPHGRLVSLSRTTYADGFVEVFVKSLPHKAYLYLRSQNPTAKGTRRGDWVALVYA